MLSICLNFGEFEINWCYGNILSNDFNYFGKYWDGPGFIYI